MDRDRVEAAFEMASDAYLEIGVDVNEVLDRLGNIEISLHCWQADDVGGFEHPGASLSGGGIQATGNYPGKARNLVEMQRDYLEAFSMVPGKHRANIHAMYGDFGGNEIDRDAIEPGHFTPWISWAREHDLKLDFNATLFSHPKASSGFTLSSRDGKIREFWMEHVKRCRIIADDIGKRLGSTCFHNIWIPDGYKDIPVNRMVHRELLASSLDEILERKLSKQHVRDSVEGKLFGIGSEAYVVGSHDFYLSYAISRGILLTMDMGHYHPTESVADKISAILPFTGELLIHVSRGVRWDSDHVAILNDELVSLAEEITRAGQLENIHLALDYFDASINRVGAWVIGMRSTLQALLYALLQPRETLDDLEERGKYFQRLALLEELKKMPFGAVWDYHCLASGVPVGMDCITQVKKYERDVLMKRGS